MKTYVIMLAGGTGSRMGSPLNKILLPVCGIPAIVRSLTSFVPFADYTVIVSRPDDRTSIVSALDKSGLSLSYCFADGGPTRQASVQNGLHCISPDPDDIILIHDAARCLIKAELIERVSNAVRKYGSGVPGIPAVSTFKMIDAASFVQFTPERSHLYEIQTPQGFKAGTIIPLSQRASEEGFDCTDDAGLLEHYHLPVKIVTGDASNIKITEPMDLSRARTILQGDTSSMRIGMGYDVHRLVPDRKLILCGVEIPFELGLLGHSDADVAVHALMDAMLGACALGDIGKFYPDTDDQYRGISSMLLLKETVRILQEHGFCLNNADITIAAQKPRILPYIPQMAANIADSVGLSADRINIKATTTEKLGFEGRMEGISSYAVCSVIER